MLNFKEDSLCECTEYVARKGDFTFFIYRFDDEENYFVAISYGKDFIKTSHQKDLEAAKAYCKLFMAEHAIQDFKSKEVWETEPQGNEVLVEVSA